MRVIVIGAGASGIYMAYKLKYNFTDFVLDIYEKNADIGGTWFENRYPGCACDVPAHNYTYTFDPKCDWSSTYSSSREIFQYFSDFVDKHELRQYIASHHEVTETRWDENASEWVVQVYNREIDSTFERRCDFLINACGVLNSWRWPTIPGIQSFKGPLLHTAAWDDNVDLTGKRVGLIGNGSSGIQILPQIQKVAKHVTTFVRKPTWVIPTFGSEMREHTDEERQQFRENPEEYLKMRKATEKVLTGVYPLFINDWPIQTQTAEYMKASMKEKINNEELAEQLIPDFPVGCRRLTPGVNYLESLTLPNVTTLYGEITEITPTSCITSTGTETELDILICATGFDTTFRPRFPLIGRSGHNLQDEWAHEPRSYLGVAASGFPNYFMFLGPNSPVGSGPSIISIEVQGSYIAEFLNRWQKEDIKAFDPKREAVDDFITQKDLFMEQTVWNSNCKTWYKSPVTGKVTALWPGSVLHYIETMAKPRYDDYDVTYASKNRFAYLGNGFSQMEHRPDADTSYYIRARDDGASVADSWGH
ncbi:FAD/NAD(P)-binding domain-containing protein [Aspergillus campestris IBT 28561]|uniref:FAD/NAD(P)-binding domain-containing protein n=1 Tax=Aspergillus campestris (strain IBT 28561) TaxID=1392248 RepID=A0A2I1CS68_ASPC2|nr:FAD/NAD(P)-binding domain-containing protein [Aspergillus campestris IBT 28561]PKY00472.1 FAD/NAD(P)-binding domain-containing protein [Aspergillus campestris IBT 28561]